MVRSPLVRFTLASGQIAVASLIAASLVVLGGCNSRPNVIPVTGTVTYQNKPVDGACVVFIPNGSRPASGLTDAQGRFTLLSFAMNDGAVLGDHVVCITKAVPGQKVQDKSGYPKMLMVLPKKYGTPTNSPLKATVTSSSPNDFRFDLTD